MTNADLAGRVHLSPSACHRRVRRLEDEGVIEGYRALLDQRAIGRSTTIFIEISLREQTDAVLDSFERAVAADPAILECYLMAGEADYLLKVVAADVVDYERVHRETLSRLPGVARLKTHFALRTVSRRTAFELEE